VAADRENAVKRAPKYIVTLNLETQVPRLITQCRTRVQAMSPPNPWFPNPPVSYVTVLADVAALEAAEILATTKAVGSVPARDQKQLVVEKDFTHLGGYIQIVADNNPGFEATIIASALAKVKVSSGPLPRVFKAMSGHVSGLVELEAPYAGARATHYWQMSTDEKNWTPLPETIKTSTTVAGLVPGTIYYFRHRALSAKGGLSNWDQIVSVMAQ
jgi:hypothetical protein